MRVEIAARKIKNIFEIRWVCLVFKHDILKLHKLCALRGFCGASLNCHESDVDLCARIGMKSVGRAFPQKRTFKRLQKRPLGEQNDDTT